MEPDRRPQIFFNSQGFVTLNGSIKFIYLHFIEDIFLLWVIEIMLNSLFLLQKNNSMIYVTNIINNVNGASDLVVIWSHKTCDTYMATGGDWFLQQNFSLIFIHMYMVKNKSKIIFIRWMTNGFEIWGSTRYKAFYFYLYSLLSIDPFLRRLVLLFWGRSGPSILKIWKGCYVRVFMYKWNYFAWF